MTDKRGPEMVGGYVLVTTGKRGVFFGKLVSSPLSESVVLDESQACIYWEKATRGFLGLASVGPQPGSRVTGMAGRMVLYDITSVSECTDEAVEAWKQAPWS